MCPHGYHHSGSMATPALGTRDVRLHIVWIALWSIYISVLFLQNWFADKMKVQLSGSVVEGAMLARCFKVRCGKEVIFACRHVSCYII